MVVRVGIVIILLLIGGMELLTLDQKGPDRDNNKREDVAKALDLDDRDPETNRGTCTSVVSFLPGRGRGQQ